MHSNIFALSTDKNYDVFTLPTEDEVCEDMNSVADYVRFEYSYVKSYEVMAEIAAGIARSIPGATSEGNKIRIENIKESIRTVLKNKINIAVDFLTKEKDRNNTVNLNKANANDDIIAMKTSIYQALEILHDRYGWYIVDLDDYNTISTYDRFLENLITESDPLELYVVASYDYHF